MSVIIQIEKSFFSKIRKYLLQSHLEQVCFLFSKDTFYDSTLIMEVKDYYLVAPHEYEYQSSFHVELKDSCQAKVIKSAWDKKLSLGEIHSHPTSKKAFFSQSDISGFQEFVPHVWWRLKKGPYIAIIQAQSELDALAWVKTPDIYEPIDKIKIGKSVIRPSNFTIKELKERKWRKKFTLDNLLFWVQRDRAK